MRPKSTAADKARRPMRADDGEAARRRELDAIERAERERDERREARTKRARP